MMSDRRFLTQMFMGSISSSKIGWVACLWWPERAALNSQVTGLTTVMAGGFRGVLGRPLAAQVPHAITRVAAYQS